jgi:hypothetical protein
VDAGADAAPVPSQDGGSADASSNADAGMPPSCSPTWTPTPECSGKIAGAPAPDFGPNVLILDPSMAMSTIQNKLDAVYSQQDAAHFGPGRYAYFFKPGHYDLDVKIGFYVEAMGLGHSPDDVAITGAVRAKADWLGNNNATQNFWRGVENLSITPTQAIDGNVNRWAVSQATHIRRVHVKGDLALDDGGWSSGGFIADSVVDGHTRSGTQQQFLSRNNDQNWEGSNWNMVFVGEAHPPADSWPSPPYTVVPKTPRVRERPFLYLDQAGDYYVMVPSMKANSQAHSWGTASAPGLAQSIDAFYLARPADTATTLNAALARGKHLFFTPGVYHLDRSIDVSRPGTLVLGLGLTTLVPDTGAPIFSVADVDGVTLAGFILEAGPQSSSTLLELGPHGSAASHATNPTVVFDVSCRVGGAAVGTAASCATVNSSDVILDNVWLWRADHGAGADWNVNRSINGLIVNGNDVTAYGLFVEHFQQYQTLWNGNGGAVYFYQSEMPYDPPNQAAWMSGQGKNGYASYKVADAVTSHHAEGLGVYSVFTNYVVADDAIETPTNAGVSFRHMVTVSLASGAINHVINASGGAVGNGTMTSFLDR